MTRIPLVDVGASFAEDRARCLAAIGDLFDRGAFVGGDAVDGFERAFAAFVGVRHAVTVSSGTAALTLALRGLGVGPGDEVLVPAHTFVATAEAVALVGAIPVLCDVRDDTLTIDVEDAARRVGPRARAIVPVHLYGQMADVAAVRAFADARGLAVVEDAAQALGAVAGGGAFVAGAAGRCAAFSFYPTKNLAAPGGGGAVTTDDPELAARVRALREHGQRERNLHDVVGTNARLDALQCACLSIALERVAERNEARRTRARAYRAALDGRPGLRLVDEPSGSAPAHHLMVVRVDAGARERVRAELAQAGIATGVHYPRPVHLQPAFAYLGHAPGAFPASERAAREVLSLPLFPELPLTDVSRVADVVARAARA